MLHMKRKLMMAAAGVLAALMVFPAYGASRKPIKSISLTIKAEIKPDTDFGDELIEIETSSNKYSVDGYEILNDDVEWREDTVPRIQITPVSYTHLDVYKRQVWDSALPLPQDMAGPQKNRLADRL